MKKRMKYSVLRYLPSKISKECVNLGIICVSDDGERAFRSIQKWSRIKVFDDEINIAAVKLLLKQIKEDVEGNLFNIKKEFMIEDYICNFVNEFAFSEVLTFPYADFAETVEKLEKLYLRLDFDKSQRLKKNEEKEIFEKMIQEEGLEYQRKVSITDELTDAVVYDYLIGDYGIKFLNFDNKDISRLLQTVKAWAWNCKTATTIKPVIIVNYSGDKDSKDYLQMQSVYRILKHATEHIYDLEEGAAFIHQLQ